MPPRLRGSVAVTVSPACSTPVRESVKPIVQVAVALAVDWFEDAVTEETDEPEGANVVGALDATTGFGSSEVSRA